MWIVSCGLPAYILISNIKVKVKRLKVCKIIKHKKYYVLVAVY